ncbi:MAG TPA: MerR family transcriptional regulator [Thermoanaerobaculia bacterium]|nr:MerR family transcriptional regulator [Thermoanaerobaculia bacterium]
MKSEPELYKPAEACRIAEVAPYVLRYWETEFPALSEGKEKGAARLYTGRDVKIISRIRELLYDEGFTVAGAKKRLEAEISEGRFEDGLQAAPPASEQKKTQAPAAKGSTAPPPPVSESQNAAFLKDNSGRSKAAEHAAPGARGTDFPERKRVLKELREIARLLDRPARPR